MRKKLGSHLSYDELSQWCADHYTIPDDIHEAFVVSYQINIDDEDVENFPESLSSISIPERHLRLFISSKHLLSIASQHLKVLHADATYKLTWLGYPVLIIGTSDMDKVFHPLGIALCTDEKSDDFQFIFSSLKIGIEKCNYQQLSNIDLMADSADAISNGFERVFARAGETEYKRGIFLFNQINRYLLVN